MNKDVIAIFDIGKTNKKMLLFDNQLNLVSQYEEKFAEIADEDGFSCDDIEKIELWMIQSIHTIISENNYCLKAINFATYGASLAYLDKNGKRLTPIYNYLKPMPNDVLDGFYKQYGGIDEFSRKTASPALGMLNSALQILWVKKYKPEIYKNIKDIVHFPQYLSFVFSKSVYSEYTSIGCHTAMWDFDTNGYHTWLKNENIELPIPVSNDNATEKIIENKKIQIGVGIHDSSSSLVPYLKGSTDPFVLISTGTWCIFMNPFNDEPLTSEQLKSDALCYLSTRQKQVKSSRLFMGYIHDVNTHRIAIHFNVKTDYYKSVKADELLIQKKYTNRVFFKNGVGNDSIDMTVDLSAFKTFEEAYHQLIIDLTYLCMESLKLVFAKNDSTKNVFISGGFARNEIFVRLLAAMLPEKNVYQSEIDNATALGAAIIMWNKAFTGTEPILDLGLKKIDGFKILFDKLKIDVQMKDDLKDLIEISRLYGTNKNFVIAGGGNTSFKTSSTIYVKASGTNLSDIDENGFVALDRKKLSIIATKEYSADSSIREEQVKTDLMNSRLFPQKGQRPSVETSMHEIINFSYVIHTHPTIANSLLCSFQAEKIIKDLFGNSVLFIRYTDPGYILFKEVRDQIATFKAIHNGRDPQVIFLENHGVFVSANTVEEIKSIYNDIENKIKSLFTTELKVIELPAHPLTEKVKEAVVAIMTKDSLKFASARYNSLINGFCMSSASYNKGALPFTPDNIVYCKAHSIYVETTDDLDSIISELKHQLNEFKKGHNYAPKIILIKGIGMIGIEDSAKSVEIILDVYEDLMKVSIGSMNFGGPKFMNEKEIAFIDNWEVENYRRSVVKTK